MTQLPGPEPSHPPRRTSRRWGLAAGILLLLLAVHLLSAALLPFAFAAAIAYVADPAVRWLEPRLGHRRWIGALTIFIAMLALLAAAAWWAVRVLVPQFVSLAHDAPSLIQQLFQKIFGGRSVTFLGKPLNPNMMAQSALDALTSWVGGPGAALAGGLAVIIMFFLTLFLLLFFLVSGPRILAGILWLFPPAVRPQVHLVATKMHPVLYRYVGGVIIVVIVASTLTWIGVGLILRLPDALILSLAVGILEIIPVVGPAISIALLATVAVAQGKLWVIIGVALFALALRLFIDQLIGPVIIGRAVRLHPVVIIFSFLVGGVLFGILGVLLAVPAAATIKITLQTFYDETDGGSS